MPTLLSLLCVPVCSCVSLCVVNSVFSYTSCAMIPAPCLSPLWCSFCALCVCTRASCTHALTSHLMFLLHDCLQSATPVLIVPISLLLVLAVFIPVPYVLTISIPTYPLSTLYPLLRSALSTLYSALHSSLHSALFTPLCNLYSQLRSAFRTLCSAVDSALYLSCVLFILECCMYSVMHLCIFYDVFVYSLYSVPCPCILCVVPMYLLWRICAFLCSICVFSVTYLSILCAVSAYILCRTCVSFVQCLCRSVYFLYRVCVFSVPCLCNSSLLYDVCIVHFCVLCLVYSCVLLCSVIPVF